MAMPTLLHNGLYSRYPKDRKTARKQRVAFYDNDDGDRCPACGDFQQGSRDGHLRHTRTDACTLCADLDAADFFNLMIGAALRLGGDQVPVEGATVAGGPGVSACAYDAGKPRGFSEQGQAFIQQVLPSLFSDQVLAVVPTDQWPLLPDSPTTAEARGFDYYVRAKSCSKCGGLGVRHVETGECFFCREERRKPSPRQAALAAGATWYTPLDPCGKCGQLAQRRVANGHCCGCTPAAGSDGRRTAGSDMMEKYPGMVLSRQEARRLGFKVYRTGKACKRGHTVYRYVTTGTCIDCHRSR